MLKSTDSAYITVRKVGEEDNILEDYNVDLSLPLLNSFTVTKTGYFRMPSAWNDVGALEIVSAYKINADNIQYKWEK